MRAGEWRPAALGGSATVSSDVLAGRDTEITWEDVYSGIIFFFFPFFLANGSLGKSCRSCRFGRF